MWKKGDKVNAKTLVYLFMLPYTSGNKVGMCKNSRRAPATES